MNKCKNCNKETKNPKFCSRSCSVSFNNRKIGARHGDPKELICECGERKTKKAKRCNNCNLKENIRLISEKTIGDLLYGDSDTATPYRYTWIRRNAKRMMIYWNIEKKCICGYDKHVECCHKKPINDFPKHTKLKVVNGRENLIYLCRNCHWEFDNGLLKI